MNLKQFDKVSASIVVRSDSVYLLSETCVLRFIETNVISQASPSFLWEFESTNFVLNVPGHNLNKLPGGIFEASLSYLPTSETQFSLINAFPQNLTLNFYSAFESITETVKLRLSTSENDEWLLKLGELFYKRSEHIQLIEENDGWFVYMTRNSFLQRLSHDYSFMLGGRHFQVLFDF